MQSDYFKTFLTNEEKYPAICVSTAQMSEREWEGGEQRLKEKRKKGFIV